MSKRKPEWLDDEASDASDASSDGDSLATDDGGELFVKCPCCARVFAVTDDMFVEEEEFVASTLRVGSDPKST